MRPVQLYYLSVRRDGKYFIFVYINIFMFKLKQSSHL